MPSFFRLCRGVNFRNVHSMKRVLSVFFCGLLTLAASPSTVGAKNGDVTHVVSHDKTLVVTDPSQGFKLYPQWANFPPASTPIRKAVLFVTYACPDGLHCGEWDYIDAIHLRRVGGEQGKDYNIELARMISPYGWKFDSTWHFTWHVDITDFAFLLHDSVEIEFKHTGYESNTDRGWLITLDFAMTEGRPAVTCLGMDTLWCGSFPYGDTAKPIESLLQSIKFHNDSAAFVRLRIVQTGHGMDDSANCAEFCNKWREVKFDDSVVNKRQIWRECGDNPLYPQSGTWIFDRANWCPGSIVHPDTYDFAVTPNSDHTVDIDMEPYINPNKPSANWYVYAYLFYYTAPWAENDVSVEEVISPSQADEYSRINPNASRNTIRVKNNGKNTINALWYHYWDWTLGNRWAGELLPQATADIDLAPGNTSYGRREFLVTINGVNETLSAYPHDDEYPYDNTGNSVLPSLEVLPPGLTLVVRTNKDTADNHWQLVDGQGKAVFQSDSAGIHAGRDYVYDLSLKPGSYEFQLSDTAGNGLNFWYNVEGGYGYVRLIDTAGHLIKNFNSDFGNEIRYAFSVTDQPVNWPKQPPVCEIFPPRNQGKFEVDLFFEERRDFSVEIVSDSTKSPVFSQNFTQIKDSIMSFDITGNPDGVYWFKLAAPSDTLTRRIRLKHDN